MQVITLKFVFIHKNDENKFRLYKFSCVIIENWRQWVYPFYRGYIKLGSGLKVADVKAAIIYFESCVTQPLDQY